VSRECRRQPRLCVAENSHLPERRSKELLLHKLAGLHPNCKLVAGSVHTEWRRNGAMAKETRRSLRYGPNALAQPTQQHFGLRNCGLGDTGLHVCVGREGGVLRGWRREELLLRQHHEYVQFLELDVALTVHRARTTGGISRSYLNGNHLHPKVGHDVVAGRVGSERSWRLWQSYFRSYVGAGNQYVRSSLIQARCCLLILNIF